MGQLAHGTKRLYFYMIFVVLEQLASMGEEQVSKYSNIAIVMYVKGALGGAYLYSGCSATRNN